jgi:hypothetical protein
VKRNTCIFSVMQLPPLRAMDIPELVDLLATPKDHRLFGF